MSVDYDREIRPRLLTILRERASWVCEDFSADGKIDVATVEGALLCGYEIKAAKDTLTRLKPGKGDQAVMYSRPYDRVTLVCAETHVAKATTIVPAWWGLTVASDDVFTVVRAAEQNPDDPTPRIARMMWATECVALLRAHGLHKGLWRVGSFHRHADIMARVNTLPRDIVRSAAFAALRQRDWGPVRKRLPTVTVMEVV